MDDVIYKFTLLNAVRYNGKPNSGAVIGKILREQPSFKERMAELNKEIQEALERVSKMSVEEQVKELERIAPELLEEKKEVQEPRLRPLKNAQEGKVVMRVAPSSSGPLHVGHAYILGVTAELCKRYKGKLILRIEDTNPENVYPPAYEMIQEDANWLTNNKVDEVIIQSDRVEIYYKHGEKLLENGHAYVCKCDAEAFRELAKEKQACPCRKKSPRENKKDWEKMFSSLKPGEAVVRIKTDIGHKNPALRDWPAFRINGAEHPKTGNKFRVWPLMNFAVAIDDHLLGITHSVRGKDHIDNEKKQRYIFEYFGWKAPESLYVGRINFLGFDLRTSETKKRIEYKEYLGWDDIRLPFLGAFRRRGYQPEAFVRFAVGMGIHEADKTLPQEEFFKILNHHNKEIIDKTSNRYFIVVDPVEVEIENAPSKTVEISLHPDFQERGKRTFQTSDVFFLQRGDMDALKLGKLNRLIECFNFKKEKNKFVFTSEDYKDFKNSKDKGRIIHYLPHQKEYAKVEILMPDKKLVNGVGEPGLAALKTGEIIQAERVGFMRLDSGEGNTLKFWFAHR